MEVLVYAHCSLFVVAGSLWSVDAVGAVGAVQCAVWTLWTLWTLWKRTAARLVFVLCVVAQCAHLRRDLCDKSDHCTVHSAHIPTSNTDRLTRPSLPPPIKYISL